jgi:integrase
VAANPVPRGLPTRRERSRPGQGVPLVRATRKVPRILSPAEVDALTAALRTHRDRAMVTAMVLGGLRRCEVLGLRLEDLRAAERRVFITEGKTDPAAADPGVGPVLPLPYRGLQALARRPATNHMRRTAEGWRIERIIQHRSWEDGNTGAVAEAIARSQA